MIVKVSYSYVKRDLQLGEYVIWLIAWVFLGVLSVQPQISTFFAGYVGLTRGTDLVVIISIIGLFIMNYGLYKKIDAQERDITKLVREIAKKKWIYYLLVTNKWNIYIFRSFTKKYEIDKRKYNSNHRNISSKSIYTYANRATPPICSRSKTNTFPFNRVFKNPPIFHEQQKTYTTTNDVIASIENIKESYERNGEAYMGNIKVSETMIKSWKDFTDRKEDYETIPLEEFKPKNSYELFKDFHNERESGDLEGIPNLRADQVKLFNTYKKLLGTQFRNYEEWICLNH